MEPIIQSEVSQKGKHQYSILMHMEELCKKDLHNPDNHDDVITNQSQTSWNVKSSGP